MNPWLVVQIFRTILYHSWSFWNCCLIMHYVTSFIMDFVTSIPFWVLVYLFMVSWEREKSISFSSSISARSSTPSWESFFSWSLQHCILLLSLAALCLGQPCGHCFLPLMCSSFVFCSLLSSFFHPFSHPQVIFICTFYLFTESHTSPVYPIAYYLHLLQRHLNPNMF